MPTSYGTIFGNMMEEDPRDREAYTNFAAQLGTQQAGQARSDAWRMNQDNLRFGAWQQGQNAQLSREAARAQAEMAQNMLRMRLASESDLLNKQREWSVADDTRNWERGAPQRDVMNAYYKGQVQNFGRQAQIDQMRDERAKAMLAKLRTRGDLTEAQKLLLQSTPEGAVDPGTTDMLLQSVMQMDNAKAIAEANRVKADIESSDPTRRARGLAAAQASTDPAVRAQFGGIRAEDMPRIGLSELPENAQGTVTEAIKQAVDDINSQHDFTMDKKNWDLSIGRGDAAGAAAMRERIQRTARELAAQYPGIAPRDIEDRIMAQLNTGGLSWNPIRFFGLFDSPAQDNAEQAIEDIKKGRL